MLELVRRRPGLGLDDWPEQRVRALQRVIKNNLAVARTQKVTPVHCPLLFVAASQNPPPLAEKLDHWHSIVDGPIESIELDCDHRHMLVPQHMARIGPVLSAALTRATATAAGASV
jgi:thioesterase domain-containing protein